MNTTVIIATRELRERARLFLVAAVMAVIPFIVAMTPAARGQRSLTMATVAAGIAIVYSLGLAIALGVSTIGADLAEKRLSFYFSKPVSASAIWFGKAAAAMVTILLAAATVLLPSTIAAGGLQRDMRGLVLGFGVVMPIAFFFFAHTVTTMVRSRSILIALDFVLLFVAVAALYFILRPVFAGGAMWAVTRMLNGVAYALFAILAVAPVWQLRNGRIDPRRNHAALSRAIWPAIGAVVAIVAAISIWIVTAPLASIQQFGTIDQTPNGEWVVVNGETKNRGGYHVSYLVNTRTNETKRLSMAPWWGATVARNGRTAAWLEMASWTPRNVTLQVRVAPLDGSSDGVVLPVGHSAGPRIALSDDGSRVALGEANRVTVYDVATRKMLAVGQLHGWRQPMLFFIGPDRVRVIEQGRGMRVIREFHVSSRRLNTLGEVRADAYLGGSLDGTRMLTRHETRILDDAGRTIAELPDAPQTYYGMAMLNDGRVAVIASKTLHLYDRDGKPLKTFPVPFDRPMICGQIEDAKLIVNDPNGMHIVDLERGAIEKTQKGVRGPVAWVSGTDVRLPRYTADATFAGLEGGKLVFWRR
ncbi:MAG: hypothetical protein ACLGH0_08370 [Thermoanaerobaculia bacterium]